MNELDEEEKEILEAFDSGKVKRAAHAADTKDRHQAYAEAMFKKDARINIRLPSKDLRALQKKALAEGLPYQTLVASILHKYVEGRLRETESGR
ncbi:antitoxin [Ectothiorhodospira haloalkaliphila]|uniref:Antitoxin n=1 Tax=Ectothiorhodospira haloalkaliphila TaxID=421628 RepID=W8L9M8_9GAMM|nr:antitoxin [Ectothiorhodospira haloalkaliphila]AHK80525.1 antitoxin [Ectothiorhodospira haloalkaliphila]MCG5524781.1 antitoxin [Ectothiorhodospira haloalkaliphila]